MSDDEASYILDSEQLFKIRIIQSLADTKYEMLKSQNKYCSIDFMLLNQSNLLSVLIEHKHKNIDADKYDNFFIGYSKIVTLSTFYNKPLILVFQCLNELYFCEFDDEFVKRPTSLVRGSRVIHIDKSECGSGFDKLIERLKQILYL